MWFCGGKKIVDSKGIIIEARVASSRLPKKMIKKICGKPTLQLMIERVKKVNGVDKIIVATSINKENNIIEEIAQKEKISFFRGSENDVLSRVLEAAEKFKITTIISLPGDCIIIDPNYIQKALKIYENNDFDYVSSGLSKTFPIGMETQIFSTSLLKKVSRMTNAPDDREHVTLYIYKNPHKFKIKKIYAHQNVNRPDLSLVLDEKKDFILLQKIYEKFYKTNPNFSLEDVIRFLDENPEIKKINSKVKRNKVITDEN